MPSIVHATSNRTTNCTLQWTQKPKEINSFSVQYADAIYRACYQQPHNQLYATVDTKAQRS